MVVVAGIPSGRDCITGYHAITSLLNILVTLSMGVWFARVVWCLSIITRYKFCIACNEWSLSITV